MIRFACPACGKIYKAEDGLAGRKTACKSCHAVVVIPEQPVREVLYGTALPPEGMVESTQEPDAEPPPEELPPERPRTRQTSAPFRDDDYDEPDEDDWESRRKPGKVSAIAGMLIGGGAWAIFANLFSIVIFPLWCFWPGLYFGIIWAILAIVRGAGLLGDRWHRQEPRTLVVLQIVQAVNLDIVNIAMGIVGLVFLNDRQVRLSFRRRRW